jgi:hypothetical protein
VGSSGQKHKHPGDSRSQEQRMEAEEKAAATGPFKASTWAWLIIFVILAFVVWYFVWGI